MNESTSLRTIKSYVVRGGRLTPSQEKALANYWPEFGLERENGCINAVEIFTNTNPLVFEIGFGMGDSLVQMAKDNPQQNFIGVDVHPPGIGTLLRKLADADITNVRVYQNDAKLVLQECIADNSLDKLQIFFPDPWHKKRHHKRRLIQPEFINRVLPKIKQGGLIHLATDWENYAEQMLEVLEQTADLKNLAENGKYSMGHDRPVTKFQRRGEKLGHGVWDLIFKKISAS
tara:strand:+ start:3282 stop:3974 length:693 start_codon:yes stop_codon:yes gene_type:complete